MRYRCDDMATQKDGAKVWTVRHFGLVAKIENCRLANMAGDMRRTVTITGEPGTFFSIPAQCSIAGATVKGYVTGDGEGNLVFRQVYY